MNKNNRIHGIGAVIKNNRILKYLLMMVVILLLVLNFSIGVSASTNYDSQEADARITISERLSVQGGSNSDVNISKRNTPDQDALIQLAKELKKNGGATYEDAEILIDWAKEYNVPYHEIEVHPNRPGAASNVPHFHIGKTGHIPIIGDIPTWLEEVLYDN